MEEVRHYRDPPVGVVQVMDAICLLFSHPPGWESAKQLLSQADFFQVGKKCLAANLLQISLIAVVSELNSMS